MSGYAAALFTLGLIILLTAWLPLLLKKLPLSLPIACIGFGLIIAWLPLSSNGLINPLEQRELTERLTEIVVIVSLMGAGLKIDRIMGWRSWGITWRLLVIAMPLTIAATALLGHYLLGLGLASALLFGAAMAPTDPVLASDVQVGPPRSGEEDEVRFALTSEAGLNDGLSFPFINLAIALALWQAGQPLDIGKWIAVDVVWKIAACVGIGWLTGWGLGYVMFKLPMRARLSGSGDGFAALGATLLTYGLTELAHGYGFIAVFVAAVSLRSVEREHEFHEDLHRFAEQTERLLMMLLLVCFGMALGEGKMFADLTWHPWLAAIIVLLVIRPAVAGLSLTGSDRPFMERAAISFFGIRGLGSIYYVAYATGKAEFEQLHVVWQTVFLVILLSIILHGLSVTPAMRYLDNAASRRSN